MRGIIIRTSIAINQGVIQIPRHTNILYEYIEKNKEAQKLARGL